MYALNATGGRAAGNASWRLVATAVDAARAAICVPLIARELGVAGYGAWSVVATIIALLHPLAIGGSTSTLVREVVRDGTHAHALLASARRMRISLAVCAVPVAALVAGVLGGDLAACAAAVVAFGLLCEAMATSSVVLAAGLRDDLGAIARVLGSIAATVGVAVVVRCDLGLVGIAAATLAGVATTSVVAWTLAHPLMPGPAARPRCDREVGFGIVALTWPIALSSLFAAALLLGDVALVNVLAGPSESGVLGACGRVLAIGVALPAAISAALVPVLSIRRKDALALTRRAAWTAAVVGTAGGAAITVMAPLVGRMLGHGFEGTRALLPIIGLRVAIASVNAPWSALLLALRGQHAILAIQAATFACSICAMLVVVPRYGAVGAAWIGVAGELTCTVLQARAARRRV